MSKNKQITRATPVPTSHNLYSGYSPRTYNILGHRVSEKLRLTPDLTPINTGKVLIGSGYQPTKNHVADDQLWLQSGLLQRHGQRIKPLGLAIADKVLIVLYVVAIALVWATR